MGAEKGSQNLGFRFVNCAARGVAEKGKGRIYITHDGSLPMHFVCTIPNTNHSITNDGSLLTDKREAN